MSRWNRTIGDCSRRGFGYLRTTDQNGNCLCCWCRLHAEALAQSECSLFNTAKSRSEYWDRIISKFALVQGVEKTALVFGVEPATVEFLLCHGSQHLELDVPRKDSKVILPSGQIETFPAGGMNISLWPEESQDRQHPAAL